MANNFCVYVMKLFLEIEEVHFPVGNHSVIHGFPDEPQWSHSGRHRQGTRQSIPLSNISHPPSW